MHIMRIKMEELQLQVNQKIRLGGIFLNITNNKINSLLNQIWPQLTILRDYKKVSELT
jgi:starvation-inducible outer membrane lipoprotein